LPLNPQDEDNTERKIDLYKKEKENALRMSSGHLGVNNKLLETERSEFEELKSVIKQKLLASNKNKTEGPEKYLLMNFSRLILSK
jgi:hypothetical protein